MHEELAVAIAVIIAAGVGAQWLAALLRVPSVLVLLPAGVLVGPVLGLLVPERLFGEAIFPLIAIAVGLVLFEGGVGLRLAGAREVRRPVVGLVTVGVAITWAVGGAAATLLFAVPPRIGFLLGAILVVSGPTVVLPLLDSVRLRDPVGPVLRWECIVIDPIGAVLAVAVLEAILDAESGFNPLATLAASSAVGVAAGATAGIGLALLLKAHAIPDRLHNSVTLAFVVGCFVVANLLSVEAGLFATTVMGIVLVNQRLAPVAHIAAFGEDLGVLVLGGLFVVLGATVDFSAMRSVLLPSIGLLVVLLAVRPAAVWVSTLGAGLRSNERRYLSVIAPRGVVAAAIAALFSVSLEREGIDGASDLAPAAFVVIIGSVMVASLAARPAAHRLRVAEAEPRGILLAGSQQWMLDVALALAGQGVPVLFLPGEDDGADAARAGLLTYTGPVDGDELAEAINAVGVGIAVISSDDEAMSSFLVEQLSDLLGRRHVYRVTRGTFETRRHRSRSWGRIAFEELAASGDTEPQRWEIVEFPAVSRHHGPPVGVLPLFVLRDHAPPKVVGRRWRPLADGHLIGARPLTPNHP